jgi:eukaryotic-like serine/threonine-protein kinase
MHDLLDWMAMRKLKWLPIILISIVLIQSGFFSTAQGASTSGEWTTFRHDSNHSGIATSNSSANSAELLWRFPTSAPILSSPAVADGVVVFGCKDCYIYCVNASNGGFLWRFRVGHEVNSSPAIYNGKVYVGCSDGWVYCMNISSGTPIWGMQAGGEVWSSPAVVDDRVYIGSGLHDIYCYNAYDGAVLWMYPTIHRVLSSPAVADGVVYVACNDFHLYALNATTGQLIWRQHTGSNINSPCIYNGYIFIGAYDGWVTCRNASTGARVWLYQTEDTIESSAAVAYGRVYIGSNDGRIYCLNASDGVKLWETKTGYWVWSSPAVANGNVFVGSQDYNLYCLDAFDGSEKWSFQAENIINSSPSIAYDTVYFGSNDYNLYALTLSNSTVEAVKTSPILWSTVAFDVFFCFAWAIVMFVIVRHVYFARKSRQTIQTTEGNAETGWLSAHANGICVLILVVFLVAFLLSLGGAPLWAADEKTYSQLAYHMVKSGDYFMPWANGQPSIWVGKPPLLMWLMSVSYQIFGVNNFSTRIWAPLFGVLSLLVVFFLGKKLYNRTVGLFSTVVLGTFTTFFAYSTHAMTDIPLVFFMLASIYYFLLSEEKTDRATWYALLSGVLFGLALMTKQLEALLIPAIIIFYLLFTGRIRHLPAKRLLFSWGVAAAIFVPYVIYMAKISKEFLEYFFVYSNVNRIVSPIEGHSASYLYYFNYLLTKETFWAVLLPFAVALCLYKILTKHSKADTMILVWIIIVLGIFTVAQTKLHWYILPAMPAFALAISSLLYQIATKIQLKRKQKKWHMKKCCCDGGEI